MQSEKRLRGHTFYVNPDSGADSHDRRSVSSRWQWSRSHFVQTNNTAFYSPPPGEQTDPEVAPDTSLPTNQTTDPITARPARSPARPLIIPQTCHRGRSDSGSCFKGDGRRRRLILRLKEGNKCQAALGIYGNYNNNLLLRVVFATKYQSLLQHFLLLYTIKPCCLVTTAQRIFTRLQFPSALPCWPTSLLSVPFLNCVSVLQDRLKLTNQQIS